MLRNYFTLAARHLLKNRTYATINILGLATGIAACLLIFRLVHYELSFDRFRANYDRIYRVVTNDHDPNEGDFYQAGIPIPAMDVMQTSVPQFEAFARTHSMWPTVTVPESPGSFMGHKYATNEEQEVGIFTEPDFFKIIQWEWLAGDPETALGEVNSVVLTEKMAKKCFGSWQLAMGKNLVLDNAVLVTVRGIIADPPANSDFQIHLVASYATLKANGALYFYFPDWGNTSSNCQAYALLREGSSVDEAKNLLAAVGQAEYKNNGSRVSRRHSLQPLADLHYDDRYHSHFGTHSTSKNRLGILSVIGLLVLAMACFNFINLATAQAAGRSREVGVRKSLGGSRGQLVAQFMGETVLIVALAVVLGGLMAMLLAPLLKYVSDVPDTQPFLTQPAVLGFMLLVTVFVSLLSGSYPALILSGFNPVKALKNNITTRTVGGFSLRKVLVVTQFVIAQGLIIGTLVTVSQMNFLRDMDLGFQPDLVYVIEGISPDSVSLPRYERFKRDLQQIPSVEAVSFGSDRPSSNNTWSSNFALGRGAQDAPFNVNLKFVDPDYLETYGLRLVAGRDLEPSDTIREMLVNETLLRKLGISNPEDALGKELRLGGRRTAPVVGVVADFQSSTARDEQRPYVFSSRKTSYYTAGIKIRPDDMSATTAKIAQIFEATFPEQVFDGGFLDEKIAAFYRDDERLSALCKGFAFLAILISCLGLYGLASLLAVQKTKEIGVRKVLGASVSSVIALLSKDFLLLVLLAAVVATPVAWWAMSRWLEEFVYRAPLSVWIFAGTVGISLLVALLTVGAQTWKAARVNPVKSLRSE
ncbi:MAG: ABC transporter permease [Saprospiraceae bacterium]|nr:ABC transporter permease [Saprospiraceae bacterium]